MLLIRQKLGLLLCAISLAACSEPQSDKVEFLEAPTVPVVNASQAEPALYPGETPQMRVLVNKYADFYGVPRALVHKVVQRESDYRANARNGPYYGLMQILPATARGMGFRGSDAQLLDAETNLTYAVKYLRGAWLLSDGDMNRAVMHYARGYYYEARNRCMLVETGLREREVKKYCPT